MNLLGANFFQLSNAIFYYGLTPIQLSVYGYLVSTAGQKGKCWPGVRTIAERCGCSPNAARAAVAVLQQRGLIRKAANYVEGKNGQRRQTSNRYFILDLPDLPPQPIHKVDSPGTGGGGEIDKQDEENKIKTPA